MARRNAQAKPESMKSNQCTTPVITTDGDQFAQLSWLVQMRLLAAFLLPSAFLQYPPPPLVQATVGDPKLA